MKNLLTSIGAGLGEVIGLGRKEDAAAAIVGAFEQSPNCTLLADAATLQLVGCNAAMRRALGYATAQLQRLSLSDVFDRAEDQDALLGLLRNPDPKRPLSARQRGKDGKPIEVEIVGYRVDAPQRRLLAFMTQDVTLRNRFEARQLQKHDHLDHLAHHDALTGLPNRLYLSAHLPNIIENARRNAQQLAVLFLDLDRFKHINDSRGHEVGDLLLAAVARRMRELLRERDIVVRMGGDEFIVVLRDIPDQEHINATASRLLETLARPFDLNGHALATSVSIGISQYPRDGVDMSALLRRSDIAMYQAKECGRNTCQRFSPVLDRRRKRKALIEAQLREALLTGQLDVHYQPVIDLVSQQVAAVESLLRWKHAGKGYISPRHFIEVAEETGLIVPIGEFVLQRVVSDAANWRASGGTLVPIAMNVSAVQLQRSNLVELISKTTRAHQLDPSMLQIELTESTLFERREGRSGTFSLEAVASLRALGVHIALDDFGTGYSSLSLLKHCRVDSLKIDGSLVRDLMNDPGDLALVGAIIAMARHLSVPVTAEGIEGWQQLAKLRELGCQFAQGHLFARPLAAEKILPYLKGGSIDLNGLDPTAATMEATALNPVLLDELLMTGTGS